MPQFTVLDYSNWRPPSPQALVAAGVHGVMRYVAPHAWGWPKAITPEELHGLLTVGLEVGFNFEAGAGDWQYGFQKGFVNGQAAAVAMSELGLPQAVVCHPSFDTEVQPSEFGTALAYAEGFMHGCGHRGGAYGEGALIEHLAANGALSIGWESESTSFPGNSSPTAHTALVQHYGQQLPGLPGQYDVNTLLVTDWGQYPAPVAPKPIPPKVTTGGRTVDLTKTKAQLVTMTSKGLGAFDAVWDTGSPVAACWGSVHGPDPEANDGWWDWSLEGQARFQERGNTVVITGFFPRWKVGDPAPQVRAFAVPS